MQKRHADCVTESGRGRRQSILHGERGSTTIPVTPDDGKPRQLVLKNTHRRLVKAIILISKGRQTLKVKRKAKCT